MCSGTGASGGGGSGLIAHYEICGKQLFEY